MDFTGLIEFIEHQMRMSHIYQPLLIRTLADAGGTATVRQIAQAFLLQDESQILYYESRIKNMPVPVLQRHGVVERKGDLVSLTTHKLSLEQRSVLRMLCEQKIQEYISRRGLGIWDYRMLETEPVSDIIRLEVLRDCGGRCAACGATKDERPLHIDHIKARSLGGTNEKSNLQVLCDRCNLGKSNKIDIDFRGNVEPSFAADCPFCSSQILLDPFEEYNSVFAVFDQYPVTEKHLLVIPRKHRTDFFSMTEEERHDSNQLLRLLRNRLLDEDQTITGFNVGSNCGGTAGQTILHAHIHLIPRRVGDLSDPRGGVRGVIPARMKY